MRAMSSLPARYSNSLSNWGNSVEIFRFSRPVLESSMTRMNIFATSLVVLSVFCCVAFGEPTPLPVAGTGIAGIILIAPAHPGPSKVDVPDTAPLANTAFVVAKGNKTIASFTTDAQGAFRVILPPGHYTISRKDAAPRIGRFGPFEVDVAEGQIAKVKWTCDSGMR